MSTYTVCDDAPARLGQLQGMRDIHREGYKYIYIYIDIEIYTVIVSLSEKVKREVKSRYTIINKYIYTTQGHRYKY